MCALYRFGQPFLAAGAAALVLGAAGAALAQQTPSFEQVMAAPDDVRLNLDFAIAEANAGNLLSAASTLERVLLHQPGAADARLLYAAVLIRLDDLQGAQNQLDSLNEAQLSALQRQEAQRYRALIRNRRAVFTFGGDFSLGVIYEDDALGAAGLQLETPLLAPVEDNGASAILAVNLNAALKLNEAGNVTSYWNFGYFEKEGVSGIDTDYRRLSFGTGVAVVNRMSSWRLGLVVREFEVSGMDYLSDYGVRFEATRRPNTRDTWFGGAEITNQQYVEPAIDPGAAILGGTHDGERYDIFGGMSRRLNARTTVSGEAGLEYKDASYYGFSYYAPRIQASYSRQFQKAAYLNAIARISYYDYTDPDFYLGGVERRDTRLRLRTALGAPLSYFSPQGATGDTRENIGIEGAVFYDSRDSNAPLADLDNIGAEVRLIARFGARQ